VLRDRPIVTRAPHRMGHGHATAREAPGLRKSGSGLLDGRSAWFGADARGRAPIAPTPVHQQGEDREDHSRSLVSCRGVSLTQTLEGGWWR